MLNFYKMKKEYKTEKLVCQNMIYEERSCVIHVGELTLCHVKHRDAKVCGVAKCYRKKLHCMRMEIVRKNIVVTCYESSLMYTYDAL